MTAKVYVGTSGWQYDDWRGRFYPEDMPKRAWLEHLANTLDSVEVNGTFYSLPSKDTVRHWADETPTGFRIATKMWRGVTHYKKLKDPVPKLKRFFDPVEALPKRQRGPVLIQLPPNQGKDVAKLDAFLGEMKRSTPGDHWKRAIEFRSDDWIDDEVYDVLDRHRTALCLHDMQGRGAVDEPNDAAFVYIRRHGPRGDVTRSYTKSQIRADAKKVRALQDDGRTVFVYYNNDVGGHAPRNALALKEAVGR